MKHITTALERIDKLDSKEITSNSSLLQRILALDNDSKIATVLALDMFLVGIDTVRKIRKMQYIESV